MTSRESMEACFERAPILIAIIQEMSLPYPQRVHRQIRREVRKWSMKCPFRVYFKAYQLTLIGHYVYAWMMFIMVLRHEGAASVMLRLQLRKRLVIS